LTFPKSRGSSEWFVIRSVAVGYEDSNSGTDPWSERHAASFQVDVSTA
jgi:hypothetical protein